MPEAYVDVQRGEIITVAQLAYKMPKPYWVICTIAKDGKLSMYYPKQPQFKTQDKAEVHLGRLAKEKGWPEFVQTEKKAEGASGEEKKDVEGDV